MQESLAPIVLFVFNRPWHTEQTLLALQANVLASQSKLFVFADGPKKDATQEEIQKVENTRQIVTSKPWCQEITLIKREENLGLAKNVIDGVTEIVNRFGKVIVLEDDLIVGKYFLNFKNKILEKYLDEQNVFGVSAYCYPFKGKIEDKTYFLPIACSWSYATWVDRWKTINWNSKELIDNIERQDLKEKINFGGYQFFEMLVANYKGHNNSWAIRFYANMFLQQKWFVFPNKSLVSNIGFDGTGTHCENDDFFKTVMVSNDDIDVKQIPIKLEKKIIRSVERGFEENFKSRKNHHVKDLLSIFKKYF